MSCIRQQTLTLVNITVYRIKFWQAQHQIKVCGFIPTHPDTTCMLPCFEMNYDCAGTPQPPGSLDVAVLSSTDSELSVNLTWSPSHCVMVYYVEVTATNINFTNTTTSQHITLTLQIGVEYSFRVRGADTINRLEDWSNTFVYTPSK